MAITSYGYDGSIGESVWARMAPRVGTPYWVTDPTHLAMTKNASVDRGVDISPGEFGGAGVFDTSDEKVTVSFDPVSKGWRYDLIVARRNWQGVGGKTTFEVIKGGSTRRVPQFNRNPGVLDDQLLALVPIQAGRSQVDGIIDLRGFAMNSACIVRDPLAMEGYNNWPGMVVHVGREIYTLQPDRTWVRTGLIQATTPAYRLRLTSRRSYSQSGGWENAGQRGWSLSGDNSAGIEVLPSGTIKFTKPGQYAITTNFYDYTDSRRIAAGSVRARLDGLWVKPTLETHINGINGYESALEWVGTIVANQKVNVMVNHHNSRNKARPMSVEVMIEMVG